MNDLNQFYIDGEWTTPSGAARSWIVDPATEERIGSVALGDARDVDRAVAAARRAFASYSLTSVDERLALLASIMDHYEARFDDLVEAVTLEMGAPRSLSRDDQVPAGLGQFRRTREALSGFDFQSRSGSTAILYEPVGVCALITPWNWPLLLIGSKVAPAIATGCTMVLKPSELAPLSAVIIAEILHDAGVPRGVFNLVHGDGPTVGGALSRHEDVDMVSITGSTRAGVEVARNAAPSVKRVHQELGGKSAHIVLSDADLPTAITYSVTAMMENAGQSCDARSRILVPRGRLKEAGEVARRTIDTVNVGSPQRGNAVVGPVVSASQYDRVQGLIARAIDQGATLVAGGLGRPRGLERGYYVRPTVLSNVTNEMEIAREEVFGPVVTLIAYDDDDDAIRIANDSPYGLSGAVSSGDLQHARDVARRIRAGMFHINGKGLDGTSPFGGYKRSGNGREYGVFGLREFLEVKSVFGFYADEASGPGAPSHQAPDPSTGTSGGDA